MYLRAKTLGLIGTAAAVSAVALYFLLSYHVLEEFRRLERERTLEHVDRVARAVRRSFETLAQRTLDRGRWDDTYRYLKERNPEYARANLVYGSLARLGARHIGFFDPNGNVIEAYEAEDGSKTLEPLSADTAKLLGRAAALTRSVMPADSTSGLVSLEDGVFIVATGPISDGKGTVPVAGSLLLSQPVDPGFVRSIAEQTKLDVELLPLAPSLRTAEASSAYDKWVRGGAFVQVTTGDTVLGHEVISDLHGEPAILIRVTRPRTIYSEGITAAYSVFAYFLGTKFVSTLLFILLLDRLVIVRLRRLSREVALVRERRDPSRRVSEDGADELALLGRDINAMIKALEEARAEVFAAKEEADAANRAKSQFLANISHEIRTPLHGILGMLRILLADETKSARREHLSMANDSANKLLDVINDVLDFSKVEAGRLDLDPVPFDIRAAVKSALQATAIGAFDKGVEVLCEIDPAIPARLVGDPVRLRQVLINLLGNSTKFTHQGAVGVRVRSLGAPEGDDRPRAVTIECTVWDTGIGIPPDKVSRVFAPFTQADGTIGRRYQGTGLGLTITKQLVELMGGKIEVTSRVGSGSAFTFTAELGIAEAAECPEDLPAVLDGKRVLCVTSNLLALPAVISPLAGAGAEVDNVEGIDPARGGAIRYDVVVADGAALERLSAESLRQLPALLGTDVVALVSPVQHDLRNRLLSDPRWRIVSKPFVADDLLRACAGGPSGPAAETALAPEGPAVPPLRVLVADDTRTNQVILELMLKERGHSVTLAGNGKEVIDLLKASGHFEAHSEGAEIAKFDIVLTDIQMPELDGMTMTTLIRELEAERGGRRIPIVAVTAHALPEERRVLEEAGVDGVVTKPIDVTRLAETMLRLSGRIGSGAPSGPPGAVPPTPAPVESLAGPAVPEAVRRHLAERGESDEPLIDIEGFLERTGGSRDFMREVLVEFGGECRGLLDELKSALSGGDASDVTAAAHAVKGTLLNIGAGRPAAVAKYIETNAVHASREELSAAFDFLEYQVAEVIRTGDAAD